MVGLVYDELFLGHGEPWHPESRGRLEAVLAHLQATGWLGRLQPLGFPAASAEQVTWLHDAQYIEELHAACESGGDAFSLDTIATAQTCECAMLAAGGCIAAVHAALGEGPRASLCLVRPPGHHATADRAMGFCFINNVALAAEICDGWLPIFYTPRMADTYNEWLDEGFARPGARRSREDFEICATANIVITDDRAAAFAAMKPYLALYMGGMGAEDTNFHADVYRRMGYAEVVDEVTALFRSDQKDKAAEIIPDEVVDDSAIVGDLDYVRKQIKVWEAAGVTTTVV